MLRPVLGLGPSVAHIGCSPPALTLRGGARSDANCGFVATYEPLVGGDEYRVQSRTVKGVFHRGAAPGATSCVERHVDVDDASVLQLAQLAANAGGCVAGQRVCDLTPVRTATFWRKRGEEPHELQSDLAAKNASGHKNLISDRWRSRFVVLPRHPSMMPHTSASVTFAAPHNAFVAFVKTKIALITPFLVLSFAQVGAKALTVS